MNFGTAQNIGQGGGRTLIFALTYGVAGTEYVLNQTTSSNWQGHHLLRLVL